MRPGAGRAGRTPPRRAGLRFFSCSVAVSATRSSVLRIIHFHFQQEAQAKEEEIPESIHTQYRRARRGELKRNRVAKQKQDKIRCRPSSTSPPSSPSSSCSSARRPLCGRSGRAFTTAGGCVPISIMDPSEGCARCLSNACICVQYYVVVCCVCLGLHAVATT